MAVEKEAFLNTKKYVREKIRKIFDAAQEQYGHQKLVEKCRKVQKKCNDEDIFLQEFTTAIRYALVYSEKLAVDNILSFVSKYISLLYTVSTDKDMSDSTVDECAPLVTGTLEFLFKSHGASMINARLRCMQLLSKILTGMPENSLISDEVWHKLKETVLCRIQDKNPSVRAQAVLTARMLQDPKNSNCEIIKALIFHFNDPSSAVRRAVVSSIALSKLTIGHILSRTRDTNDNVRRNAFLVFSKIKILNLTIKYRVTILDRGLQDRSEMVRKCVQQIVLVNWLENLDKDILKFLEALDVVNCSEIAIKSVEAILKMQPMDEVLKQLPIEESTHLITKEKLTPESVLFWRCLANYFWKEGNDENLDSILPNLTVLCDYIREFYKFEECLDESLDEEKRWEEVKEKEILKHLLQIVTVFDLSDEMGRIKLKELIVDMLISPRIPNTQVKQLVELLVPVIPSKDDFLQELTEVISEIREPIRTVTTQISHKEKMEKDLKVSDLKMALNELREKEYDAVSNKNYAEAQILKDQIESVEAELKLCVEQPATLTQEVREEKNDPVTLCKCLSILVEMIRSSGVKILTPRLLNLKENFLNQCMTCRDLLTQSLAIEALAQFCILDKELAKENLVRFLLMISEDGDNEINIPSLKAVFDIIHIHGTESFEQLYQNEGNEEQNNSKLKNRTLMTENSFHGSSPIYDEPNETFTEIKCLKNLKALLYCKTNDALKTIAYEGLCKLLLSGVIHSPSILSKIIIKGFSPIIESESEDLIRQTFMVFFPIFAANTPRSQEMIEATFIPTIKTIFHSPLGSPDADINPKEVMTFLIDHTKPDINKFTAKTLHVHNNLAIDICHEIYHDLSGPNDMVYSTQIYLKCLDQLEISFESEAFLEQLRTLTGKIEEMLKEVSCIRSMHKFKKKMEERSQSTLSSVENTLTTTRDSRSSKQALEESNQDDCSVIVKTTRKSVPEPARRLQRIAIAKFQVVSESSEVTSDGNGSNNSSPTTKIDGQIVPESPEVSEDEEE